MSNLLTVNLPAQTAKSSSHWQTMRDPYRQTPTPAPSPTPSREPQKATVEAPRDQPKK